MGQKHKEKLEEDYLEDHNYGWEGDPNRNYKRPRQPHRVFTKEEWEDFIELCRKEGLIK